MSDFFEEYGWLAISIIGGAVGIGIFAEVFFADGSSMAELIKGLLGGLM